MWVFSDAGTTATGERLYSFTHRTFLEYFAAAQLAYASDSPEQLAHALISATSGDASLVVAELAVQIKDRTSNDGAPRIYGALLDGCTQASGTILGLLALCLRSVDPSPRHVRELTRLLFEEARDADQARYSGVDLTGLAQPHGVPTVTRDALLNLMLESGSHRDIVADEVDNAVADVIRAGDRGLIVHSLRLAFSLAFGLPIGREQGLPYWRSRVASTMAAHRDSVVACARTDAHIRFMAVRHGLITTRQALELYSKPHVIEKKKSARAASNASW
jgi:hypothetical protein